MTQAPQRRTRQRAAVARALADAPGFQTAQDVHALVAASDHPVGLATVYRTLQALADAGEADSIRTPDGQVAYRHCGTHHHHHLICRSCGRTEEIALESLEAEVTRTAERLGFTRVDHDLELFGLCADCS